MRFVGTSLVLTATFILQVPAHRAGPRMAPVPKNRRSSEQQSVAAKFASADLGADNHHAMGASREPGGFFRR